MTYVRHCTQPSLAGLLSQLAHAPALTCRAIFTRPFGAYIIVVAILDLTFYFACRGVAIGVSAPPR